MDFDQLQKAFDAGLISEEAFRAAVPMGPALPPAPMTPAEGMTIPETSMDVMPPAAPEPAPPAPPVAPSTDITQATEPQPAVTPQPADSVVPEQPAVEAPVPETTAEAAPPQPAESPVLDAVQNIADVQKAKEDEKAAYLEKRNEERHQIELEAQEEDRRILGEVQKEAAEIDAEVLKLSKMEPKSFFGNMGAGEKIMAAIGLALGAYSSAKTGGPNVALQILNAKAADFKTTEAAKYDRARDYINNLKVSNDKKRDLLKTLRVNHAAKLRAFDLQTEKSVDVISQKSKSAEIQANADKLKADYREKQREQNEQNQRKLAEEAYQDKREVDLTIDKAFAKEYVEYQAEGGSARMEQKAEVLYDALDALKQYDPGDPTRIMGLLPDSIRDLVDDSKPIEDQVKSVIQQSLRDTLGAQFAEKEGQQILDRAYNPRRSMAENIKSIEREIAYIKGHVDSRKGQMKYFEDNRTLKGWKAPAKEPKKAKKVIVKKQYSPSKHQTRFTYEDGTVEVKDGQL